jgi:ribosomal-protein-alanine N-acetyltransferase
VTHCKPMTVAWHSTQPTIAVQGELTLRPWREGDADAVRAAFADAGVQRWHVRRMDSDDEARDWIAGWAAQWTTERGASWAVADPDDRPLGQVGLRQVDLFAAHAQLSYWTLPHARGHGVAARATRALTDWAFDVVGLHRLEVLHSVHNGASCRVAVKAGYPLEVVRRGHLMHTDGWHDAHVHARLRHHER